MSLGVVLFLLPNRLSSGGFSGITTVLYYLINLQIGTTTLIMNIPLFIIAYFKIGKRFLAKAIYGTITFSILLNIIEGIVRNMQIITDDKLLASIYGGIIIGVRNSNHNKKQWINRWNRTTRPYNSKNKSKIQNRKSNDAIRCRNSSI